MRKTVLVCDHCGIQKDELYSSRKNHYTVGVRVDCDDKDPDKTETITLHMCGKCTDLAVIPFRNMGDNKKESP